MQKSEPTKTLSAGGHVRGRAELAWKPGGRLSSGSEPGSAATFRTLCLFCVCTDGTGQANRRAPTCPWFYSSERDHQAV